MKDRNKTPPPKKKNITQENNRTKYKIKDQKVTMNFWNAPVRCQCKQRSFFQIELRTFKKINRKKCIKMTCYDVLLFCMICAVRNLERNLGHSIDKMNINIKCLIFYLNSFKYIYILFSFNADIIYVYLKKVQKGENKYYSEELPSGLQNSWSS